MTVEKKRSSHTYTRADRQKDNKAMGSLAKIATKHNIDAANLIEAIMTAWKKKKSNFKKLSIECRQKSNDKAIYLFMNEGTVIAQFQISQRVLQRTEELADLIKYPK